MQHSAYPNANIFSPLIIPVLYHLVYFIYALRTLKSQQSKIQAWIAKRELAYQIIQMVAYLGLILFVKNRIIHEYLITILSVINLLVHITCILKFFDKQEVIQTFQLFHLFCKEFINLNMNITLLLLVCNIANITDLPWN